VNIWGVEYLRDAEDEAFEIYIGVDPQQNEHAARDAQERERPLAVALERPAIPRPNAKISDRTVSSVSMIRPKP